MSTRYMDEGYPLLHWATEIQAKCPKCKSDGLVKGNPSWKDWRATFFCCNCSHSLKTEKDAWLGPLLGSGKRPCGKCGHQSVLVETIFEDAYKVKSDTAISKCPQCKAENDVPLTFTKAEPLDHAIDPFFGLELSLKEDTRHGTVWVYGSAHLEQLKLYTSAQLREGSGTKWSYFTRMPKWLKSAKNRSLILKSLSKLEKRLITSYSNGR